MSVEPFRPCDDDEPERDAGGPIDDGWGVSDFQAKLDRDHAALGGHEEVTDDGELDPGAEPG